MWITGAFCHSDLLYVGPMSLGKQLCYGWGCCRLDSWELPIGNQRCHVWCCYGNLQSYVRLGLQGMPSDTLLQHDVSHSSLPRAAQCWLLWDIQYCEAVKDEVLTNREIMQGRIEQLPQSGRRSICLCSSRLCCCHDMLCWGLVSPIPSLLRYNSGPNRERFVTSFNLCPQLAHWLSLNRTVYELSESHDSWRLPEYHRWCVDVVSANSPFAQSKAASQQVCHSS